MHSLGYSRASTTRAAQGQMQVVKATGRRFSQNVNSAVGASSVAMRVAIRLKRVALAGKQIIYSRAGVAAVSAAAGAGACACAVALSSAIVLRSARPSS